MIYRYTEDIDLDQEYTYPDADQVMRRAANLTINGLEKDTNLYTDFRALSVDLLKVFLSTHCSLLMLLAQEEDDPYVGADALSLAREQVEKVFAVALLCEDLPQWVRVYLEHAWRRTFERYLLEKAEREHLPRFRDYFPQAYVRVERLRQRLGIADNVRDAVEYRFFHPDDPPGGPPTHVAGVKLPRQFPSPKGVISQVSAPKQDYLQRWYAEYRFFCEFTHSGMGKLELTHLFDRSSRFSATDKEEYYAKEVHNAAAVSYVSVASACTELTGVLGLTDVDRLMRTLELWDFWRARFLLAKALWDLRARQVLCPLGAS
jgi:hypothetical protein